MNELPWYALKVRTRSETLALASLDHYGFETYCPQTLTTRKYSDRFKVVSEPVFPGYLFCRFDLEKKGKVLSSNAVERVVGFGSQPSPVESSEIDAIRRMVEQGARPAPMPTAGDRVRVKAGPLRGVEGTFVGNAAAGAFVVSIELLQRSVSLNIDQASIALV